MHLPILALTAALSACTFTQDPVTPERTAKAAPALGEVFSEMDPRIWVIHESQAGDLWFGSNGDGLYRYDGAKLIHYTQADGLSGVQVRGIEEDKHGHTLIATYGGVSKFDGEHFTTLELVEHSSVDEGWRLNPDDVWIVYAPGNYGPCYYDGEKLHHLQLSKSPAEDAFYAEHPGAAFHPADLYSIHKDRRGHLWFGTANAGICRYDGEGLSWLHEDQLTDTPSGGGYGIRSIHEDRNGDFWISNTRQRFEISPEVSVKDGYRLIQYEKKEGLPEAQADADENFAYFSSMLEDDAGALWMVSGTDGVRRYDGETVTRFPVGDQAYAMCIERGRDGKLWVGTLEHGVFVFDGEGFESF